MKTIKLNFEGYWTSKEVLPEYSGVYCVYRAVPQKQLDGSTKVTLKELIYIGKAEDETIRERHQNHERQVDFENELREGEVLRYATVEVTTDGNCVENGLVFKHKPRLNSDLRDYFNHPDTHFIITGDAACLTKDFSVEETD